MANHIRNLAEPDVLKAAERVNAAWGKSIEAIIATGELLLSYRERWKKSDPGKWSRLICDNQYKNKEEFPRLLGFGATHAKRLVAIAEAAARLRPHAGVLPSDSTTMAMMATMDEERFDQLIEEDLISPELTRSDLQLFINRADRAQRFSDLASEPLPDGQSHVLYADPPWAFKVWEESSAYGAALEHYPTMTIEKLCELDIGKCAPDDAVLFMWVTAPTLREAFMVLDAWRFQYVTHMMWDKEAQGMGYYVRNQHEPLIIATRGDFPLPDPANKPVSVVRERKGKHSAKPHVFYDIIERMYPLVTKREFFARYWRPGWLEPHGNMSIAGPGQYADELPEAAE